MMPPLATRRLLAAVCGAAAVGVAYLVLAMPGMDHGGTDDRSMGSTGMAHGSTIAGGAGDGLRELSVEQFGNALDDSDAMVINVHVPDEGGIAGTDADIAYDEIVDADELPADHDTPLLLYCRSGRMSRIAGDALVAAGYRNVAHLDGGMDAWSRAGRPLQPARTLGPDTTGA